SGSVGGNVGGSLTSSVLMTAIDQTELLNKIDSLQSQVAELQTLSPSLNNPWEIEVIFFPWGSLPGIWHAANAFPTSHTRTTQSSNTRQLLDYEAEAWTQTQSRRSSAHFGGQGWDGEAIRRWAGGAEDQEWMMAKACGPTS